MTQFYVIRHKPTGQFLPARVPATSWGFEDPNGVHEPRLFKTARAAKNCATCWAQGVWTADLRTESEGWEYDSYTVQDLPTPNAVPGRQREDLEVLPALLIINP
jgi:hypothetical protein